jgi:hypothetical protein
VCIVECREGRAPVIGPFSLLGLAPILRSMLGHIPNEVGSRVVDALGAAGARELLEVLGWLDTDRAALSGRLYVRDDARWLAELLIDLEDIGETVRVRLVEGLRKVLRGSHPKEP